MVDRAHRAWREGHIAGVLMMDIKAAFQSVGRGTLIYTMRGNEMEGDLIRWMASCLTNRTVEIIIKWNVIERHLVEAGMPMGSLVSPMLFVIYIWGLMEWVEERVSRVEGQSFVDDAGCVAMGSDVSKIARKLEVCTRVTIDWADRQEMEFDTANTKAALFTCRGGHKKHLRPKLTVKIGGGNSFVRCNKEATRWLGVWMDAHLTFKMYHSWCMKKGRAAEARLWSLTGTYGVVPPFVGAVQVAGIQAVALYGCKLWREPKDGSQRDDLPHILNRQASYPLGKLLTTPRGAPTSDPGLTPAAVALNPRQQLFMAELTSMYDGSNSQELYHDPTPHPPVGRVAGLEHACGRTAETMCWPDPGEEPAVKTTILEDDATAKRAAEL